MTYLLNSTVKGISATVDFQFLTAKVVKTDGKAKRIYSFLILNHLFRQ